MPRTCSFAACDTKLLSEGFLCIWPSRLINVGKLNRLLLEDFIQTGAVHTCAVAYACQDGNCQEGGKIVYLLCVEGNKNMPGFSSGSLFV